MSGALPETFPCPWCGMSYPAKPVLVGRAVRCKGCRNGFVLQADGVATQIQEPPPTTVSGPQVPAAAEPPAPPRPRTPVQTLAPAPTPAPKPSAAAATPSPMPAKATERISKRKTEQLEAARAQMAAQLAVITQQAAAAEVAKSVERKSERVTRGGTGTPSSDSKRPSREAILTGEGHRQHQELRLWWLWLGVSAAVILLLVFVFSLTSATREALQRYAAPVEAEQNRYPLLGDVLRARAWLTSAQSMPGGPVLATDLSDASFGAERTIEFAPLRDKLATLKGMRFDAALGLWLAPADLDKARAAAAGLNGNEAIKAVAAAKVRCLVHSQLVQQLGLPEEDLVVLLDLLTGVSPPDGEPIAARLLDLGELPDRVVVRTFRGRQGSMLVDIGRPPYRSVQGLYTGTILRFEGARWPIGWRVLQLDQVK